MHRNITSEKERTHLELYSDPMILQFKIDGLVVGGIVINVVLVWPEEGGMVSPTFFTIPLPS